MDFISLIVIILGFINIFYIIPKLGNEMNYKLKGFHMNSPNKNKNINSRPPLNTAAFRTNESSTNIGSNTGTDTSEL